MTEKRTLKISKIINRGAGLGRNSDNKVVLIPYTLPGEIVSYSVIREHPDYIEARLEDVIEPSPDRCAPLCGHYKRCGGCMLQHATYPAQLRIKRDILAESLQQLKIDPEMIQTIGSPSPYNCRNTAVFHVRNGKSGFFAQGSETVVNISECPVLEEGILEHFKSLAHLLPADNAEIRVRRDSQGVIVSSLDKEKNNAFMVDGLAIKVWIKNFFQANTHILLQWLERMREYLSPEKDDTILDLYSGTGIISLYLARGVSKVTGIEEERAAVKRAIINSTSNNIPNTYFFAGRVDKLLSRISGAHKVVVDPPRGGIGDSNIISAIAGMHPSAVIYSSCDAATFSRDAVIFRDKGYTITKLTMVDMFPQSSHFEVISRLEPYSKT